MSARLAVVLLVLIPIALAVASCPALAESSTKSPYLVVRAND
jgi:hypothetical protein